jgi:hypothetical protein
MSTQITTLRIRTGYQQPAVELRVKKFTYEYAQNRLDVVPADDDAQATLDHILRATRGDFGYWKIHQIRDFYSAS